MFWVKKVLAPATIVAGMTAAAIGLAQPPGGEQPPERKEVPRKSGGGDPSRMFDFLARGTGGDVIDFGKLDENQRRFIGSMFERIGMAPPPATGTMTRAEFLEAANKAMAAKGITPGQPPEKKGFGEKKGFPGRFGEKKGTPLPFGPRGREGRADPAVEAWVKVLLDKITDPHDTIRDSARAAVVAVGPPALPPLRELADGDDGAKATAARKLIAQIEGTRGGPVGPGGPGFGPVGPGGPGGPGLGPRPGGPGGPVPGEGPGGGPPGGTGGRPGGSR
jgi:hypothetical protein